MSRTIIFGDVHGCYRELCALLDKLAITRSDKIISVGDLVDKGPQSLKCLRLAQQERIIVTLGNHEDKYLRIRKHELKKLKNPYYTNPIKMSEAIWSLYNAMNEMDFAWLEQQPYLYTTPYGVIVHAGLMPDTTLEETISNRQLRDRSLRMRYLDAEDGSYLALDDLLQQPDNSVFWTNWYNGPWNVIYGHTVHDQIRVDTSQTNTCWGIDTGVVYGGSLTALVFEGSDPVPRIVSVRANKKVGYHAETGTTLGVE